MSLQHPDGNDTTPSTAVTTPQLARLALSSPLRTNIVTDASHAIVSSKFSTDASVISPSHTSDGTHQPETNPRRWKPTLLWASCWYLPAFVMATALFFAFAEVLNNPGLTDEEHAKYKYKFAAYATAASHHRRKLLTYVYVSSGVTMIMVTGVISALMTHWKKPILRVLLPGFLFYLGACMVCMTVLEPVLQTYLIYSLDWNLSIYQLTTLGYLHAIPVGMMGAAPVLRLRALYLVFVVGDYETKYWRMSLRVLIQTAVLSSTYFFHFVGQKHQWVYSLGMRLNLFALSLEMIYYAYCLRNTKYMKNQYAIFVRVFAFYIVMVFYSSLFMPGLIFSFDEGLAEYLLNSTLTLLTVWTMAAETVGPALFQILMQRYYHSARFHVPPEERPEVRAQAEFHNLLRMHGGSVAKCEIDRISEDAEFWPILMDCANARFCVENLLYIRACRLSKRVLDSVGYGHMNYDETALFIDFFETFIVEGCPRPVNLSSEQLKKLRAAFTVLKTKGKFTDPGEIYSVLNDSRADVSLLFEMSGVLSMFRKDERVRTIYQQRSAERDLGLTTDAGSLTATHMLSDSALAASRKLANKVNTPNTLGV